MKGPITWEVAIGTAMILGAIIGVWLRIKYYIKCMMTPVQVQISALQGSVRLVENQLSDHKLYAAEHYARDNSPQSMREEILNRLDQMLVPHLPPAPLRARRTRG